MAQVQVSSSSSTQQLQPHGHLPSGRRTVCLPPSHPPTASRSTRKHHRVNSSGVRVVSLSSACTSSSGGSGSGSNCKKRVKTLPPESPREPTHISAADNMASSFLQFCPICDKQQAAPSVANLYCSESCRQKDSIPDNPQPDAALPLSFYRSSSLPSYTMTAPDFAAMTTRVVPERAPSTLASLDVTTPAGSSSSSGRTATPSPRSRRRQPSAEEIRSTAALNFLAQFHNSPADMHIGRRHRSASRADSGRGLVREPSLDHSNGTTPSDCDPSSPFSLKRLGGSHGSLPSLAPLVQSPTAPEISDSDMLEMDKSTKPDRGRSSNRAMQDTAAKESLMKMLPSA